MSSPGIPKKQTGELWDKMVIREAREEAQRMGVSVADWEEARAMAKALQDSVRENVNSSSSAGDGLGRAGAGFDPFSKQGGTETADLADNQSEEEEEEEEEEEGGEGSQLDSASFVYSSSASVRAGSSASNPHSSSTYLPPHDPDDSIWFNLPSDITILVHQFMGCIDTAGYMSMLCHGARYANGGLFYVAEKVYQHLCQQIFLKQFHARKLALTNFKSWKSMAIYRPRLRTNGFYSLRTVYSKPPCTDYFWEEKQKRVQGLECHFYRHFRFYDDNKCLYSLSVTDPWSSPFKDMKPVSKKIYSATYVAKGRMVEVHVPTHYCEIFFTLEILDGDQSYSMYSGKHSVLRILSHRQMVGNGEFATEFALPMNCDLRFYRRWLWVARDFFDKENNGETEAGGRIY